MNIFNRLDKLSTSFIPETLVKRDEIIGFIIKALKPYIDEKGLSVTGLKFYVLCATREEEESARVALYMDKPGMFRSEHLERKLLNHFIQLEPEWFFESELIKDQLPEDCLQQGQFGLKVVCAGERVVVKNYSKAKIQVLVGQAEFGEYILDPQTKQKFNIGRSKTPQLSSGKVQLNDIVFLALNEPGFDETAGRAPL